jgi:hypothetical protein
MPTPIYYHFQQRFNVPARKAFEWCTTYTPGDHALMGDKDASRKIEHITDRTVILTDTFNIGADNQVEKQKLVQLYPEILFWTSTHLNGPAKHSQFIYQITEEAVDISHLDFTGLFLDRADEKYAFTGSKCQRCCNCGISKRLQGAVDVRRRARRRIGHTSSARQQSRCGTL